MSSDSSYSGPVSSTTGKGRQRDLASGWKKSFTGGTTTDLWGGLVVPNVSEVAQSGPQIFSWEGSVLSASSSIFWSLLSLTVKLSPSTAMAKLLFHVTVGVFVGIMTCMGGVRVPYGPLNAQVALFFRSILVSTSLFARLFALRYLTLVDAFVLNSISPMFYLTSQCIAGGKKFRICVLLLPLSMTFLAFAIIVLSNFTYRKADAGNSALFTLGVTLSLTSSALRAIARYFADVTRDIPKAVLIFHWSFLALFASCCMAASLDRPWQLFDEQDMGVMVFIAKISFASVYFLNKARELESYGMTNIFLYVVNLGVSCAMAKLLLKEDTAPLSYLAAALVAVSVIFCEVAIIAHVDEQEDEGVWNRSF